MTSISETYRRLTDASSPVPPSRTHARLLVSQVQATLARHLMREETGGAYDHHLPYHYRLTQRLLTTLEQVRINPTVPTLVDLFITTSQVADRFGIPLQKAYTDAGYPADLESVTAGDDTGRPTGGVPAVLTAVDRGVRDIVANLDAYDSRLAVTLTAPSLTRTIPRLQVSLIELADLLGLHLLDGIAANLRTGRLPRPGRYEYLPAHTQGAELFRRISERTYCPFAASARIWGAPDVDPSVSLPAYLSGSVRAFRMFARAAAREMLDGFVYAFPARGGFRTQGELSALLYDVLRTLRDHDPGESRPELCSAEVRDPRWRFSWGGEHYFVPVFAPLYRPGHSRYTYDVPDMVFVLLQPDSSFHSRLTGDKELVRGSVRRRFAEGLQPYATDALEAHKFLPPTSPGGAAPDWFAAGDRTR
jgi:hypothetical protein